jgi:hypothetical protein
MDQLFYSFSLRMVIPYCLTIFVSFCIFFVPACSNEKDQKIVDLTKKVETLTKQKEQDLIREIYELQERCGKTCEEAFKKEYGKPERGWLCNYTNHYNKKLNKCFILVSATHYPGDKKDSLGITTDISLWDINEKKQYGQFFNARKTKFCFECEVAGKHCTSEQEWEALVKPYMEE